MSKYKIQPLVDGHAVNIQHLKQSSTAHAISVAGPSKHRDNPILGDHEISINYSGSGKLCDRKTIIVYTYFQATVASTLTIVKSVFYVLCNTQKKSSPDVN